MLSGSDLSYGNTIEKISESPAGISVDLDSIRGNGVDKRPIADLLRYHLNRLAKPPIHIDETHHDSTADSAPLILLGRFYFDSEEKETVSNDADIDNSETSQKVKSNCSRRSKDVWCLEIEWGTCKS